MACPANIFFSWQKVYNIMGIYVEACPTKIMHQRQFRRVRLFRFSRFHGEMQPAAIALASCTHSCGLPSSADLRLLQLRLAKLQLGLPACLPWKRRRRRQSVPARLAKAPRSQRRRQKSHWRQSLPARRPRQALREQGRRAGC